MKVPDGLSLLNLQYRDNPFPSISEGGRLGKTRSGVGCDDQEERTPRHLVDTRRTNRSEQEPLVLLVQGSRF